MMDIVGGLAAKRQNLVERKRAIESDYKRTMKEVDDEISKINKAFAVINDVAKDFLCKNCGGSGSIRYCDAAGDMDDDECPDCGGTGIQLRG